MSSLIRLPLAALPGSTGKKKRLSSGRTLQDQADLFNDDEEEALTLAASRASQQHRRQTVTTKTPIRFPLGEISNTMGSIPEKEKLKSASRVAAAGTGTGTTSNNIIVLPPAPTTRLSSTELSHMYTEVIKLATNNKITTKNTWTLSLIDHMQEILNSTHVNPVVEQKGNDEDVLADLPSSLSELNFQRASCTLDASIQIYSSRVDSVHHQMYKVLGGLTRGGEGDAADDDDDDENANTADPSDPTAPIIPKRKAPRRGLSTLETRPRALNTTSFDLAFEVDPLFAKTSASFDEGGARGMLMNQLHVIHGCDIALDSSLVMDTTIATYDGQLLDLTSDIDVTEITRMLHGWDLSRMTLCPTMDVFHRMKHEWEMGKDSTETKDGKEENDGYVNDAVEDDDDDDDPSPPIDLSPPDIDLGSPTYQHELEIAIAQEERMQHIYDDEDDGDDASITSGKSSVISNQSSMKSENSVASIIERVMHSDSAFDHLDSRRDWSGASHWKFMRPTTTTTSTSTSTTKRSSRTAMILDFNDGIIPDHDEAFHISTRTNHQMTKSAMLKAESQANTLLLPRDIHFPARRLQTLFLKPHMIVRLSRNEGEERISTHVITSDMMQSSVVDVDGVTQHVDEPLMYQADDDDDNDNTPDMMGMGMDGATQETTETGVDAEMGWNMLAQPNKVEKIDISYATVAKRVDVRALKQTLWKALEEDGVGVKKENKEKEKEGTSFQSAISTLSSSLPTSTLSSISVPFCFICLLHLANEKHLQLIPNDTTNVKAFSEVEKEMEIDIPKTRDVIAEKYHLGDFKVLMN